MLSTVLPYRDASKSQKNTSYREALRLAMKMLADDERTIFIGQSVGFPGTAMYDTLSEVPSNRRIELPVFEDTQLGMAIGMSLTGVIPVCIYPRWNFLLCATNQLVNHLDKLPLYSGYRPRVIIRTAIATDSPLNPGPQHLGDFSTAFRSMLSSVKVVNLDDAEEVVQAYRWALAREGSTLLVEWAGR